MPMRKGRYKVRVFNGKAYYRTLTHKTKALAENRADAWRIEKNSLARVVKSKDGYSVWVRKKR